jgi:hypothetical protein
LLHHSDSDKDSLFALHFNFKIAEYLTEGFVRKLSPEEAAFTTTMTVLPHFGATSQHKPEEFRFPFDPAEKAMWYSLQDFIVSGKDLFKPLSEVLYKLREGGIAFTGDIADMFHRVAVRVEDQDSQHFLWKGMRRHQEPEVYVMQVMTFGRRAVIAQQHLPKILMMRRTSKTSGRLGAR